MKRVLSVILTLLLILCCMPAALADDALVVASRSVIPDVVLPENAAPQQRNAANVLRQTLQDATNCSAGTAAPECRIVLDDPSVQPPSDKDGAYRIVQKDGDVFISGAGQRGTLYGVYAFLQDVCGLRWYTHDLRVLPDTDYVTVPRGYERNYTPYFEYCETDWRCYKNLEYAVANHMNGTAYRMIPAEWGGGVRYPAGFAHTLTNVFCSAASYFDTHPEYFALRDGKRTPNQLCLTNPDVLRIVTAEVLDLLRVQYDPSQSLQIVSLTQHDNQDYCTCDACAAIDRENGSRAGTMLTFVNAVADAVREAGYTNASVDTFAYQYTRRPPTKVVPRDNVIVRLCSIECCFGHTFDDPKCPENASFMEDLEGWSKICKRIYVWDYGTNYGETFNFFPNFHVLQRNMQILYEHSVRGVYGEGAYYIDRCDGEFGELRGYLQCRLAADPYLDFDAEMNGFLQAYYGGGWQSIRDFIDLCCEKGVTAYKHAHIFQRAKGSLPGLTVKDVKKCDALWAEAKAAATDETQAQNTARSELCWRYWKASNGRGEFSWLRSPFARMQARDELYQDIVAFGNDCIGELLRKRELSACPALHLLRIPFCWTTLYDSAFWDAVSPFVEKLYAAWCKTHAA